ncbi:tRNA (5-methylaminomethyl-2-thiouridine)(34)-methyltransferase MnmD [Synechococcus sp. PCC 7336]|uniref:tRNA (5-methylaminomethyl-2-thiouridine)(34)-methyltransferase MnmD n=1 Tax=Synechococcus sp. PCC 7336 TaxID=195250 RepID=UPI000344D6EB|nr:MnmC family methyltransferase [Synechococcus sp. PCC 7336]
MNSNCPFELVTTGDGSITFYSEEFDQAFHNRSGARAEAIEKFLLPCKVLDLAPQRAELRILDVCFGLGYNSGVALERIWQVNPTCRVVLYALERSPEVSRQALQLGLWSDWEFASLWQAGLEVGTVKGDRLSVRFYWGDARQTITEIPVGAIDAIFFDPFSPAACPQLWTVEFLALVAQCLNPTGRLATYSCAAAVRSAMQAANLYIGSTPPFGRRWPGTVASFSNGDLPSLSQAELEHLQTRAAVPYRDPTLRATAADILKARQQEQQICQLESTSRWKKRWSAR